MLHRFSLLFRKMCSFGIFNAAHGSIRRYAETKKENKKPPINGRHAALPFDRRSVFSSDRLYLVFQLFDAVRADVLSLVVNDILCAVAENACRMIFVKDDIISVYKYLKRVSLCDVQSASKLYRKDNTSELINLSNNTGRFHLASSVSY